MKNLEKVLICLLVLSILEGTFSSNAFSASLYWIGNTGNWNDGKHWSMTSGGVSCSCVPTINDDVFFDANSFTISGSQVTINVTAYCKSMNWTGANSAPIVPILNGSSPLYIYGSLTFDSTMNIANFTGAVYFESSSVAQTITSAGKHFNSGNNNIYFDGTGEYILQDAFYTAGTIYFDNGQLDFNSKNVTAAIFNSTTVNVRNLILGNSAITMTSQWGTSWNCSSTNFSLRAGSSVITFPNTGANGFNGGSQSYYNLVFNAAPGYSTSIGDNNNSFNNVNFNQNGYVNGSNNSFNKVYFGGDGQIQSSGNTFSKITFNSTGEINGNNTADSVIFSAGQAYTLQNGNTISINKYLQANGECGAWIDIKSGNSGSQATISSATTDGITINYVRMWDINATGGASFSDNNAVDNGDNTGWAMNTITPKNLYWIGNTGNWNDGTHWSLTSGGSGCGCIPTIYDDVFFDTNSFTGSGAQVSIKVANQKEDVAAYCHNMNWTGANSSPILPILTSSGSNSPSPLYIYGSLTFVPTMNIANFYGAVYFEAPDTGQTITMAGQQFSNGNNNIYFEGTGGYILKDAFYTAGNINFDNGQLDFNNKNVTANNFNSTSGHVRNLILGSSAITMTSQWGTTWNCSSTNFSLRAGSSVITFPNTGANGFNGGSQSYYNLVFNAAPGNSTSIGDNNNSFNNVNFNQNGYVNGSNNSFNKVYFRGVGQIQSNGNTFSKITFDSTGIIHGINNVDSVIFKSGQTYTLGNGSGNLLTVNKYLQAVGNPDKYIALQSSSAGNQAYIHKSSGNVCAEYLNIKDINVSGGAGFFAGNSVDLGNNSGWYWCSCSSAPSDEGVISGSATVCQGQSNITYRVAPIDKATSYIWTLPSGATGSSTADSITVNFGSSALSGNVTVRGANSCGHGPLSAFPVTLNLPPSAAGIISGTSTVCPGQNSVSYTIPAIDNAITYVWTLPSGATGTSTTNNITVDYGNSAASGNITVAGNNICGEGVQSNLAITVNPFPANAGVISGLTTVCQGQNSVSYTVPAITSATTYVWSLPEGASGTSTSNSITVNYSKTSVSGNILVKGNNSCGDGSTSNLAITMNPLPANAGAINGLTSLCQGQDQKKYTIPAIADATSYIWTLPTGAAGTSSADSILIDYSKSAVSGEIKVTGHNACGNGVGSALAITVNPLPANAGTISGPAVICLDQNIETYIVPAIADANSYVWTLPPGATGASSTDTITVGYGSFAVSGNVKVFGQNSCGIGVESTLAVSVNNKPAAPVIELNGNVLHSNTATGNQWYDQHGLIIDSTSQDLYVKASGDYFDILSLSGCSSHISNIISVVVSGIELNQDNKTVKVYPNPVSDELIIEVNGNMNKLHYEILNSMGQVVSKGSVTDKTVVNTKDFAPGIYLIRLDNGKSFAYKKFAKE